MFNYIRSDQITKKPINKKPLTPQVDSHPTCIYPDMNIPPMPVPPQPTPLPPVPVPPQPTPLPPVPAPPPPMPLPPMTVPPQPMPLPPVPCAQCMHCMHYNMCMQPMPTPPQPMPLPMPEIPTPYPKPPASDPSCDMSKNHDDMEVAYIKKMYPPLCQKIQKYIECELNQYDHDLSPIYEMYPSTETIDHMANCIYTDMKADMSNLIKEFEGNSCTRSPIGGSFYTLVYALLLNELYRKRMRRRLYR